MTQEASPAPLDRRRQIRLRIEEQGFGWLLGLISASLAFQMAAPQDDWARIVIILLQGVTLVIALRVSGVRRGYVRGAAVVAILALLIAIAITVSDSDYKGHGGGLLGMLLAFLAPAALLWGILNQTRHRGQINLQTMFGVLCVYLLIGTTFSFMYQTIAAFNDGVFFAQTAASDPSDVIYFSFGTITTVGFGDLTAEADLGKSLAVTEALIGQIYLVTLVGLIVGNLGRPTLRREAQDK